MKKILLVMAFFALTISALSLEKEIKLQTDYPTIKSYISISKAKNKANWDDFIKNNGNWTVSIEPISSSPVIAYGKPIALSAKKTVSKNDIEKECIAFLTKYEKTFNIKAKNLKIKRSENVNGKWYVSFTQFEQGAEVIFSEVELRINKKNELFSFRIHYFNDIPSFASPIITPNTALKIATEGMINSKTNKNNLLSETITNDKLFIVPIYKAGKLTYKMAYRTTFKTKDEVGSYVAFTDVHNGLLLSRENQIQKANTEINFTLSTVDKYPIDEPVVKSIPYFKLNIGENTFYSDNKGKINFELESPIDINFPLESKYCEIKFDGGPASNSTVSANIKPGENEIYFDDANTNKYERFALYHMNHCHDWITQLDTAIKCMENKFVIINHYDNIFGQGENANAYSNGDTIGFVMYAHETELLSTSPAVLYHEYGHSTTTNFWRERGAVSEINASCHEAIADITAAYMLDDSHMGKGVFKNNPNEAIREMENDRIYPDDVEGESHYDSQILSGAMWDMRKAIGLDLSKKLVHFARYGMPDDYDYGTACAEWLVEILNVDDDNGDFTDGTPNMEAILDAFNKHQIGLSLLVPGLFEHKIKDDSFENVSNVELQAGFKVINFPIEFPKVLKIVYSLDGFITKDSIIKNSDENNTFSFDINTKNKAGLLQYYFEYTTTNGIQNVFGTTSEIFDYNLLTGFKEIAKEDFETADNISIETKNTNGGEFEIGTPEEFKLNFGFVMNIQPGTDMSKNGTKCLVTGATIPTDVQNFMDLFSNSVNKGTMTVTTKEYNVENYKDLYVSFYLFEAYFLFSQTDDSLANYMNIECSADGADNWITIHKINKYGNSFFGGNETFDIANLEKANSVWKRIIKRIPNEFQNAKTLKFRISTGINPQTFAFMEVCFDELQLLAPINSQSVNENNILTVTKVYPNPCKNNAVVEFNSSKNAIADIQLFKSNGELILNTNTAINIGENSLNISNIYPEFSSLTSGSYYINIIIDSIQYSVPLIISK